jgi:cell shape-determining protein MreC
MNERLGVLDSHAKEHLASVREQHEQAMGRFSENLLQLSDSSKEACASMVREQNAVIGDFSKKMGTLSSGIEEALSSAAQSTQRAVASFGDHVAGLEKSSKEGQATLQKNQESAMKSFAEQLNRVSGGIEQAVADKLKGVFSGVESVLGTSVEATQKAVGSFTQFVQKLDASAQAQQQTLIAAQEESLKRTAQTVQTIASGLETSIAERLKSTLNGMESTLSDAAQTTQKAVASFGSHLVALESSSKNYQQAVHTSHEESVKQFTQNVHSLASGMEHSVSERLRSVLAGMENTLSNAAQTTQRSLAAFNEHLVSLESTTKGYQQTVRSSQEDILNRFGAQLQSLSSSAENAVAENVRSIFSGIEGSLAASLQNTQRAVASFAEQVSRLESVAVTHQQTSQQLQAQLNQQLGERIHSLTSNLDTALQQSVLTAQQTLSGLETGIRHLNGVLEQLGTKQIVIQQAPKKGWFSRG